MRILLSAYACRPNAGSEPGVGWNWATHLAAHGIEVHVLVAERNRMPIEAGLQGESIPNLYFHYVAVPHEWAKKYEGWHYLLWQFSALKAARELCKGLEFHLAHHVTYASVHVPTQLWRLGIPVLFGPVGGGQTAPASMLSYFGPEQTRERRRTQITDAMKFSPFHRHCLRKMSFIFAANADTLSLVESVGCNNLELMCDTAVPDDYLADQPRRFEPKAGSTRLLWVGRFLTRKALPLALDAMQQVPESVTLTVAGDGPIGLDGINKMICDRGLMGRVFWKGSRFNYQELREAYAEHDAILFTSLRDSFGSQLLEAMALGLPVISLDLHGAHDHVPAEASIKVPVSDPEGTVNKLAAAIREFTSLPTQKKNEMSAAAWRFAKRLTWPQRVQAIEGIYQQVLSNSARPPGLRIRLATASA